MRASDREVATTKAPPGPHRFKKGEPRPEKAGRKQGTRNRTTAVLKEAILMAAELEGMDGEGYDGLVGFLRSVAKEDIRTFCGLLGRVLPYTISQERETVVEVTYRSSEEVRRELASRGIDISVMMRLMNAPPIEHDDAQEPATQN